MRGGAGEVEKKGRIPCVQVEGLRMGLVERTGGWALGHSVGVGELNLVRHVMIHLVVTELFKIHNFRKYDWLLTNGTVLQEF